MANQFLANHFLALFSTMANQFLASQFLANQFLAIPQGMMMHRIGSLQERQFGPRLCGRRVENCGSTLYSNKLEISCLTHCVGDVVVRRSVVNVGIVAACMLHQGDFWILVDVLTVHNRRTFHYTVSKSPCSRELWKAISVEQPSAWYSSGDSLIVVV